jgi:hypothetical protein
MSNQIQPHYVTFEQAKWLKEKGFDVNVKSYYTTSEEFTPKDYYYFGNEINYNSPVNDVNTINGTISRPEQHQVVEWLRVNHGIWIEVRHIKTFGINRFHIMIWDYKNTEDYMTIYHDGVGPGYKVWDTPQEAYSAAFDDILNNLL